MGRYVVGQEIQELPKNRICLSNIVCTRKHHFAGRPDGVLYLVAFSQPQDTRDGFWYSGLVAVRQGGFNFECCSLGENSRMILMVMQMHCLR